MTCGTTCLSAQSVSKQCRLRRCWGLGRSATIVPLVVVGMNVCCPVLGIAKVLKQLATYQQGHLGAQMLNIAAKRGVDMVQPLEIIETWHEYQRAPAMRKGLCDKIDDRATTSARRNRSEWFKASSPSRHNELLASARDNLNKR